MFLMLHLFALLKVLSNKGANAMGCELLKRKEDSLNEWA